MKSATTKEEAGSILRSMNWYAQLPADVVTGFLSTMQYVEGHLAHMEQDPIRKILGDKDFLEFLTAVGTDEEKFKKYGGRFCTGDIASRYCADGSGFCDPSWCHGN